MGAKLLYPGGRVQHVGVLLGMGGVAGHFGAGVNEDDHGWMSRNVLPHDVSAVTGACMMIERDKFDAVGGFDEIDLPVELNDVDLCLRLAARGWRTICNHADDFPSIDSRRAAAAARFVCSASTRPSAARFTNAGAPSFATIRISIRGCLFTRIAKLYRDVGRLRRGPRPA